MDLTSILLDGFFTMIAAAGFAGVNNPPKKAFLYCMLIAAVGHVTRDLLMYYNCNIIAASFIGALLLGTLGVFLAAHAKFTPECISYPALLPMIPGMYAYRTIQALFMCIKTGDETPFNHFFYLFSYNGIYCLLIVLAMVIGTTIPMITFRKVAFTSTKD